MNSVALRSTMRCLVAVATQEMIASAPTRAIYLVEVCGDARVGADSRRDRLRGHRWGGTRARPAGRPRDGRLAVGPRRRGIAGGSPLRGPDAAARLPPPSHASRR